MNRAEIDLVYIQFFKGEEEKLELASEILHMLNYRSRVCQTIGDLTNWPLMGFLTMIHENITNLKLFDSLGIIKTNIKVKKTIVIDSRGNMILGRISLDKYC